MSFRNHKFRITHNFTGPVMQTRKENIKSDGSVSVVEVDSTSENFPMPEPSDYTLDKLINAGVPLTPVSSSLLPDTDSLLNSLNSDNNEN